MRSIANSNQLHQTMYGLLIGVVVFAVVIAAANVGAYLTRYAGKRRYEWRNAIADWSLVLGVLAITAREAHSEFGLPLDKSVGLILCFWPILIVTWFCNLRYWSLRRDFDTPESCNLTN